MTLKATAHILFRATDTKKLVRRLPFRSLGPSVRELYVTPEVADALDGTDPNFRALPTVHTERLIAIFDAGQLISASLLGSSKKRPDMERLRDLDEVWAFCVRKPQMWQLRILGRFLDHRIFVGLSAYERRILGGTANYNDLASAVPEKWVQTLGDKPPFRAKSVEEYLGGVCPDVDEE